MVTTPAEQEAERRYLSGLLPPSLSDHMRRKDRAEAFVEGWNECESRYRELLEAAREYRGNPSAQLEADELGLVGPATCAEDEIIGRLLAAAAALEE